MRNLSSNTVNRIKSDMEETFFDVCQVGVYSETIDSHGDIIKTWTYGAEIDCGAELLSGYEKVNDSFVYTGIVAKFRLPQTTVLSSLDRVKYKGVEYGVKSIIGKFVKVVQCEHVGV
jgi:hypothetical protein